MDLIDNRNLDLERMARIIVDENTEVFVMSPDWTSCSTALIFSDIAEVGSSPVVDPLGLPGVERMSLGEVKDLYPDATIYPGARDYEKLIEIFYAEDF